MRSIVWTLLWLGGAAHADPVRIWFDPRAPTPRPTVRADIGGQAQAMLLDTGSAQHVWSLRRATAAGLRLGDASVGLDVDLRSYDQFAVDVRARIPGSTLPSAPLVASKWADVIVDSHFSADGSRSDGVLSPQRLPPTGHAAVLDFRRGQLSDEPWPQALAHLAALPRALADVAAAPSGHFFVTAEIGGREVRLIVDTGAPHSMIYEARGDDLPGDAVRVSDAHRRITVGAVRRSLVVEQREPTGDPGFDGLLGMDVLADCALAVDRARLVARCAEVTDLGAPAGDLSLYSKRVQIGAGGPWLEERVAGGYHYDGDGFSADLARDGSVQFHRRRGSALAMRSERDERAWFMDATALLRDSLSQAESLRTSFEGLPRLLAWVWSDRQWSLPERREILFRIWDEAAEPDDAELGGAGAHARKIIERFVRRELPAGSADGFTDEELRRFNARRAHGPRFDPYHPLKDRGVAMAD